MHIIPREKLNKALDLVGISLIVFQTKENAYFSGILLKAHKSTGIHFIFLLARWDSTKCDENLRLQSKLIIIIITKMTDILPCNI